MSNIYLLPPQLLGYFLFVCPSDQWISAILLYNGFSIQNGKLSTLQTHGFELVN